jgi:hypothetical protein
MTDPITPLTPAEVALQEQQAAHEDFVRRVAVATDVLINVFTGGDPDETISSRAARASQKGSRWGIEMSKFLDLFQKDHGAKAQAGDLQRAEAVAALEKNPGGSQ